MTQCPKCQAALKDDYGMVTCPSCGSILFIDMDGIAHMGQEEESPRHEEEVAASEEVEAEPVVDSVSHSEAFSSTDSPAEPAFHFEPPTFDETPLPDTRPETRPDSLMDFAIPGAEFGSPAIEEEEPAPLLEPLPESLAAEADFSMDSFLGFGDPPATEIEAGEPAETTSPDDPLGLNDFANSEISQAKDGFLMFRVHIAGIDSKEIRDSIREAITDQRFAWDAAQIMSTISKGELKIDRLSPIKATILVSRIKRLPVQIRWEQYAITQTDAESGAGSTADSDGYQADSGESY